jgi:hypothetical protein
VSPHDALADCPHRPGTPEWSLDTPSEEKRMSAPDIPVSGLDQRLVAAVRFAIPVILQAADLLGGDLDRLGIDLTGVAGDLGLALQTTRPAEDPKGTDREPVPDKGVWEAA